MVIRVSEHPVAYSRESAPTRRPRDQSVAIATLPCRESSMSSRLNITNWNNANVRYHVRMEEPFVLIVSRRVLWGHFCWKNKRQSRRSWRNEREPSKYWIGLLFPYISFHLDQWDYRIVSGVEAKASFLRLARKSTSSSLGSANFSGRMGWMVLSNFCWISSTLLHTTDGLILLTYTPTSRILGSMILHHCTTHNN